MTGKWEKMHNYLELCPQQATADFNIGIGLALDAFRRGEPQQFTEIVDKLRLSVARSLTANSVTSLQSCHDSMLKLHALTEIESVALAGSASGSQGSRSCLRDALDRRLDVLGGYISDKQYLLGLRRAAMELAYVVPSEGWSIVLLINDQWQLRRFRYSRCLADKRSAAEKGQFWQSSVSVNA